ncbi:MAG: Hsp33 family molecular chaperone HslO [Candidatus Melainabacteria bacterium]|nr:Hsp33 family molecular chaperone HslO [Candidatus Melainabacteria bacterium]
MPDTDYLVKALTKEGSFRALAVSSKYLTEEARQRHNLSHTAVVALGRTFACGILLCNTLRKSKGHLILKLKGDGPLGGINVDISSEGTARGYVDNPHIECFDKKNYVSTSKALGKTGYVHVTYDNEKGIPHSGSVELTTGEIAEDLAHYLALSEQIPSFISCGVYLEPKSGKVLHAGGILIQTMPGATEEDIKILEETASKLDPFTILQRSGLTLQEILNKALKSFGVEIISEFEGICFHCPCSKEKFESALAALDKAEVRKIINKTGYAEGRCHYCNNVYRITKEILIKIYNEMK